MSQRNDLQKSLPFIPSYHKEKLAQMRRGSSLFSSLQMMKTQRKSGENKAGVKGRRDNVLTYTFY
jgi:hypothetical protein